MGDKAGRYRREEEAQREREGAHVRQPSRERVFASFVRSAGIPGGRRAARAARPEDWRESTAPKGSPRIHAAAGAEWRLSAFLAQGSSSSTAVE